MYYAMEALQQGGSGIRTYKEINRERQAWQKYPLYLIYTSIGVLFRYLSNTR